MPDIYSYMVRKSVRIVGAYFRGVAVHVSEAHHCFTHPSRGQGCVCHARGFETRLSGGQGWPCRTMYNMCPKKLDGLGHVSFFPLLPVYLPLSCLYAGVCAGCFESF